MATTDENLKEAFAGESMANTRYLAFSKQAEKDGFKNIAILFKATARAEIIHAHGHLAAMDAVQSTQNNLETAIGGETFEHEEMYPPMYEQAEREGHKAKKMFKGAMEVEKVHATLYKLALEAVKNGVDLEHEVWLCPVCGHLEFKNPPETCPTCKVPKSRFQKIS
ncbi:MAG: rubrerythrin family protein [Epsilonproteobacteria bacterium]|nr:MAG: rubrerythrin family protein [Campylobacterota bacterium]